MADAIVSAVAEQIVVLIAEQARFHINLVRGAEKEVQQLSDELNTIRFVLDDAENRRFKDDMVNYWLSRLEHTSREMEDVLGEWKYAILKLEMEQHQSVAAPKQKLVCSLIPSSSCLCFKKVVVRHDIAKKILNVKAKLDQVMKEKDRYNFVRSQHTAETSHNSWRESSTSFTNLVEILGRDSDRDILVTKLLSKHDELGSIHVVSIVGVGGLGKTTLAQLVYSDSRVKKFFDLRIWVCVSDPFDLAAIAKGIIESVTKGHSPSTNNLETLLQCVSDSIAGKTFFLVLDDVWTDDYKKWDALKTSLKCGGMGSKLLVTTRNEKVAIITGTMDDDIHRPGELSHEDSWLLLCHIAQPGKEFEEIGKKITKKCNGLPLAVKTLGSVLRFRNTLEEWENVLKSEVWQLEEAKTDLFPHLLLSYNELSPTLKRCFSYCAVFPKDFRINVESLIGNWMALGYLGSDIGNMELKGQECFDILVRCSLFQDFEKKDLDGKIEFCKMHDIVHDFAQFLRKSGKVEATRMNDTNCRACDPLLVSAVTEFCSLFVSNEKSPQNLCGCLKRLRVLTVSKCETIPRGIENMIHLRRLDLYRNEDISSVALKCIFQLYNLQTLCLDYCNIKEIPREVGNLIHLRYLNLSWNSTLKELPREIGYLIQLRHLDLSYNESLKELPRQIGKLIELRHLDLSGTRSLKELPSEIGNLIQLRHLDLSWNSSLKALPREIGNLIHLRNLDLSWNSSLNELPESICSLHELQTLNVMGCPSLRVLPEGVGQLSGLHTLGTEFYGGNGRNKLGLLNKLNHLRDTLNLNIVLAHENLEQVVEDAREAELRNKRDINELRISFEDSMDESEESSQVRMNVMDALEPHPNLTSLGINNYKGPKLPLTWIVSPLYGQLRQITLNGCNQLSPWPLLGKLPSLESLNISDMKGLEVVGREFLDVIAFSKLKKLTFWGCTNWKEWEDITEEEEDITLMPRLLNLEITFCQSLRMLPHRLLRKVAPSLESLDISGSTLLEQRYRDEDGLNQGMITEMIHVSMAKQGKKRIIHLGDGSG